jgi:glycosyltransferase involved in cell wall biosynthesis
MIHGFMGSSPLVSIITPVYNGGEDFVDCLSAIAQFKPGDWELIVVDDGSTDKSAQVAKAAGAQVLHSGGRLGPGAARNLGALHAKGEYICFIDADCQVNQFTFGNIVDEINEYPEIDAFFGSYDDAPKAPGFIAQYKNLYHRYVHQCANEEAATFWAGCGIVRRSTFLSTGGFDTERFRRPSIEDIDLGYRIKQAGGRIRVAKFVQVKHYKAWNLSGLVKTDVFDRGMPWTRLLLANQSCKINDLNLHLSQRASALAVLGMLACLFLAALKPAILLAVPALAAVLLILNRDVYRYFRQYRGRNFMLAVIPMHCLYYLCALTGFALGVALHCCDQFFGNETFLLRPLPALRSEQDPVRLSIV